MPSVQKLKIAALLYQFCFPVYRWMYFKFKIKKDQDQLKLLKHLIKRDAIILDIGANIGFYSSYFAKCISPSGHVYCFEPDAINFKHLQKELNGMSNISLIPKAIAAESGTLTLYTSGLLNVDHRTYKTSDYRIKYDVEKISIDNYVNGKFKVDFIKMDIQGFEMEALKGMVETFDANPDLILLTECWPYGLQEAGSSAMEMYNFFKQLQFNIYKLHNNQMVSMNVDDVAAMKIDFFSDMNWLVSKNNLS